MNFGSGGWDFISSLYISEYYLDKWKRNPSFQIDFSWRFPQAINSFSLQCSLSHLLKISHFDSFFYFQLSFDDISREVHICRLPKTSFERIVFLWSLCPNDTDTCASDWTLILIFAAQVFGQDYLCLRLTAKDWLFTVHNSLGEWFSNYLQCGRKWFWFMQWLLKKDWYLGKMLDSWKALIPHNLRHLYRWKVTNLQGAPFLGELHPSIMWENGQQRGIATTLKLPGFLS